MKGQHWSISGEALMEMLERCFAGEDPWAVYFEYYANSDHERTDGRS